MKSITDSQIPNIDSAKLKEFIIRGLNEDIQDGDHTSQACIAANQRSRAKLLVKDEGILAGVYIAQEIFFHLDPECTFEVIIPDGNAVSYGDVSFNLDCNTRALLAGERLALNTMQRLSGIASLSRSFYAKAKDYHVTVLDTRKTTPLLRFLEKWAVAVGGCSNYRDGLHDRIMIKDNHIKASGGITAALRNVQNYLKVKKLNLPITVEVRNMEELRELLSLNQDVRIMFDNFSPENLATAVKYVDKRMETEASGGITMDNFNEMAVSKVDFISIGALTHSARSLDLSLKIIE